MNESKEKLTDTIVAQRIRRQYLERKATKLDELQALDSKVKKPGIVVSSVVGTVGILVMGAGMSTIMVWKNMTLGLCLGIPGMITALLAYPIYKQITDSRKKRYAGKIVDLSQEILHEA